MSVETGHAFGLGGVHGEVVGRAVCEKIRERGLEIIRGVSDDGKIIGVEEILERGIEEADAAVGKSARKVMDEEDKKQGAKGITLGDTAVTGEVVRKRVVRTDGK